MWWLEQSSESIIIPRYFIESICDIKNPSMHVIEKIFEDSLLGVKKKKRNRL